MSFSSWCSRRSSAKTRATRRCRCHDPPGWVGWWITNGDFTKGGMMGIDLGMYMYIQYIYIYIYILYRDIYIYIYIVEIDCNGDIWWGYLIEICWIVIWINLITTSLRRHWHEVNCNGNHPEMAELFGYSEDSDRTVDPNKPWFPQTVVFDQHFLRVILPRTWQCQCVGVFHRYWDTRLKPQIGQCKSRCYVSKVEQIECACCFVSWCFQDCFLNVETLFGCFLK